MKRGKNPVGAQGLRPHIVHDSNGNAILHLMVTALQLLKQVKLELIAEAIPLPILFESRRKKLRRFLRLDELKMEFFRQERKQ